jgi:dTDP-4-amino-4,6-dideoxygalactose transaminase
VQAGGKRSKKWLPRTGAEGAGGLKAILPVDVFGQPVDMGAVNGTAQRHDLAVIEDACEAIGAVHESGKAGTLGHTGVFAFYPNKQMTTGEGGVVVTDDGEAADLMRGLRSQGRAPGDTWLQHTYLGYNYRMDEMSAALGCAQLGRLDELLAKRERVAGWYGERLKDMAGVQTPQVVDGTQKMSWFVYVIRVDGSIDRDALIERLAEAGIPSRPYFAPIHLQPFMIERFGYRPGDFPVTEDLGQRSLALPFSGVMTEEQVTLVCETLAKVL